MLAWCRQCQAYREVPFRRRAAAPVGCDECGGLLVSTLEKDRKPLKRRAELKAVPKPSLSRKPRERIWTPARAKVEQEGICRFARLENCDGRLECAHVIGRDRDAFPPLDRELLEEWLHADEKGRWLVVPDRVIPACRAHHAAYDRGEIGLLGRLFIEEELQAVRDSSVVGSRESGIELARRRLDAPAYAESRAA